MKNETIARLLEEAYELQKRNYFEADFCSFVIERNEEEDDEIIPSDTVADDQDLLDKAYEIFGEQEDCNASYNDTMEATIEEVEKLIKSGELTPLAPDDILVDIIVDDEEIVGAYATSQNLKVRVTDLSSAFLSEEGKAEFWKNFDKAGKYEVPVEMEHPSDKE